MTDRPLPDRVLIGVLIPRMETTSPLPYKTREAIFWTLHYGSDALGRDVQAAVLAQMLPLPSPRRNPA